MASRWSKVEPGGLRQVVERFRDRHPEPGRRGQLLLRTGRSDSGTAARRRQELVTRAVDEDEIPRVLAELIYEIAVEEGLEPAFAYELVYSGIAVCGPPPAAPVPPEDTSIEGAPEWIAPGLLSEPHPTEDLVRERRLRLSFRRLRGCLERTELLEMALDDFLADPDVGDCGYLID